MEISDGGCSLNMVKRQIRIIGIGLGSPDHLTGHAIAALRDVDVFLVADKGEVKKEMVAARKAVCEAFLEPGGYRFMTISDVARGPDAKRVQPITGQAFIHGGKRV